MFAGAPLTTEPADRGCLRRSASSARRRTPSGCSSAIELATGPSKRRDTSQPWRTRPPLIRGGPGAVCVGVVTRRRGGRGGLTKERPDPRDRRRAPVGPGRGRDGGGGRRLHRRDGDRLRGSRRRRRARRRDRRARWLPAHHRAEEVDSRRAGWKLALNPDCRDRWPNSSVPRHNQRTRPQSQHCRGDALALDARHAREEHGDGRAEARVPAARATRSDRAVAHFEHRWRHSGTPRRSAQSVSFMTLGTPDRGPGFVAPISDCLDGGAVRGQRVADGVAGLIRRVRGAGVDPTSRERLRQLVAALGLHDLARLGDLGQQRADRAPADVGHLRDFSMPSSARPSAPPAAWPCSPRGARPANSPASECAHARRAWRAWRPTGGRRGRGWPHPQAPQRIAQPCEFMGQRLMLLSCYSICLIRALTCWAIALIRNFRHLLPRSGWQRPRRRARPPTARPPLSAGPRREGACSCSPPGPRSMPTSTATRRSIGHRSKVATRPSHISGTARKAALSGARRS